MFIFYYIQKASITLETIYKSFKRCDLFSKILKIINGFLIKQRNIRIKIASLLFWIAELSYLSLWENIQ